MIKEIENISIEKVGEGEYLIENLNTVSFIIGNEDAAILIKRIKEGEYTNFNDAEIRFIKELEALNIIEVI